jgi:hypothetical protein
LRIIVPRLSGVPHGGLRLLDVGDLRVAHCRCRLLDFRYVASWLGAEAVAVDQHGLRGQVCEQLPGLGAVRHEPAILDMGMGLLDQPFRGIPGAGRALTGDPLDTARAADVLHAKRHELGGGPDLDVEEAAATAASGLGALAPGGGTRHGKPPKI